MAKIQNVEIPYLTFDESASPGTPASGFGYVYVSTGGTPYFVNDAGTETAMLSGGGSGDVATDAIWDAKGDLAVGTGANTAQKLTKGTDGYVLTADSAETTGLKWAAAGSSSVKYPFDTNYFAETKPGTANATYDDEFDDTTGMSGAVNGLDARWSWRNQGSATATFSLDGWVTIAIPASSSVAIRGIEISAFADGTYEALTSFEARDDSSTFCAGIAMIANGSGSMYLAGRNYNGVFKCESWNSSGGYLGTQASVTMGYGVTRVFYRVVKSGTTISLWLSNDGIGFGRVVTFTDSLTTNRIGFMLWENNNSGATKLHVDYFRKTA